ncbi:MAG: hypothetical protein PHF97_04155 [Bacteroidales bacterium]|nr:hypothetical protein [Bacteroidales bacterium]MDD4602983.1 hypothetical protein [Bacteroidales bacterium]
MKTLMMILTICLTINSNLVMSNIHDYKHSRIEKNKAELPVIDGNLKPATPKVADFADGFESINKTTIHITDLAPVMPKEADFEEDKDNMIVILHSLTPATPKEADFSDQ